MNPCPYCRRPLHGHHPRTCPYCGYTWSRCPRCGSCGIPELLTLSCDHCTADGGNQISLFTLPKGAP